MRRLINQNLEKSSPLLDGEIEADESYFGGVRKGKRGRGAAGKVAVFGLLKRGGKVYSQVIKNAKKKTLMPIIRRKIRADSVVYTDGFRAYNALDVSEFKHHRINHSEDFVDGSNHINGIDNFWHQAKRHLRKFNGIPRKAFPLFLKECEFRFNYGNAKEQLKTLKKWLKIYNQNRQK
ncbi:DDE transposase [Planctomycetales bacterium]|nr:DDE transposase [Planctomycetales bacterium]